MSDLIDFQALFAQGLVTSDSDFDRQPGFAVYRNTSLKAARDALGANYPTVQRLLGAEDFHRLAIDHARRCPPQTPVLAEYGIAFATTCADAGPGHPYIADVARIDRLWTEAHLAADAEPVLAKAIARLAPDELMSLQLVLHPATRHGWFETPATSIWIAHRDDADVSEIAVDWQAEGILLTRPAGAVAWHRVDADMVALLAAFASGDTMGAVATAFLSRCPDADLSGLFAQLLEAGALIDPASI